MESRTRRSYTSEQREVVLADVCRIGVVAAAQKHGVPQSCVATLRAPVTRPVSQCGAQRRSSLPWPNTFFVHQEWRLPSGNKIDLLAIDPTARSLVVIELKESQGVAERRDVAKGGTALEQARAHAAELYRYRTELYPYFERLARAP